MVFSRPPPTAQLRLKGKAPGFGLTLIQRQESIPQDPVAIAGSQEAISPNVGLRGVGRRYFEAKRLKRETKLLIIDKHNLICVSTRV
jgi:hypothetical protein